MSLKLSQASSANPIEDVHEVSYKQSVEDIIRLQGSIGKQEVKLWKENAGRIDEEREFKEDIRTLNKPTTDALDKLAKDVVEHRRKEMKEASSSSTVSIKGATEVQKIEDKQENVDMKVRNDGFYYYDANDEDEKTKETIYVGVGENWLPLNFEDIKSDQSDRLYMKSDKVLFNGSQLKHDGENDIIYFTTDGEKTKEIKLTKELVRLLLVGTENVKKQLSLIDIKDLEKFIEMCKYRNKSGTNHKKLIELIGVRRYNTFLEGTSTNNYLSKMGLRELLDEAASTKRSRSEMDPSSTQVTPEAKHQALTDDVDPIEDITGSGLTVDSRMLKKGIIHVKNKGGKIVFRRTKPSRGLLALMMKIPGVKPNKLDLKSYDIFKKLINRYTYNNGKKPRQPPIIVASHSELMDKLEILLGEFSAGNKATYNQIIAILDVLLRDKKITNVEYTQLKPVLDI